MKRLLAAALLVFTACKSREATDGPANGEAGWLRGQHAFAPNSACLLEQGFTIGAWRSSTASPQQLVVNVDPGDTFGGTLTYSIRAGRTAARLRIPVVGQLAAQSGQITLRDNGGRYDELDLALELSDGSSLTGGVRIQQCSNGTSISSGDGG